MGVRRGDQPPHISSMDSKLLFPLATAFLVLCLVETGSSIKCHQCNSYDSYHCADPFYYEDSPDTPKTLEFLQDCPADTADKTYFCRKIYQNVRGDERVIRGCGYEVDPRGRDCYTTVLEEYNTEVCAFTNTAAADLPGPVSTVMTVLRTTSTPSCGQNHKHTCCAR